MGPRGGPILHDRRRLALILLASGVLCGCGPREELIWQPAARLQVESIAECSGIVRSRTQDNVYWVHNDSGDSARIFAIDRDAQLICSVRVRGATHVDWEDIATDDGGNLYIADTGNNRNTRQDLVIYVLAEPRVRSASAPHLLEAAVNRTIPLRYPEQTQFPDTTQLNFDCEALFWDDGEIYILTKHRSDGRTVLYRVPLEGEGVRDAERLGDYDIGSQVTAADLSIDGRHLAVLSYQYIHLFERPASGHLLSGSVKRMLIEGRQCEAICFDDNHLRFTNEQDEVFVLPLSAFGRVERFLPEVPATQLAAVDWNFADHHEDWSIVEPLVLSHDIEDGFDPPADPAPRVRLGWSPEGLAVHACFRASRDTTATAERPLLSIMLGGPDPDAPTLRPSDRVYDILHTAEGLAFGAPLAEADATRAELFSRQDTLCLEARFPPPAGTVFAPSSRLTLNVVARLPGRNHPSWAWAGASSTQPYEHPLLWGDVELQAR